MFVLRIILVYEKCLCHVNFYMQIPMKDWFYFNFIFVLFVVASAPISLCLHIIFCFLQIYGYSGIVMHSSYYLRSKYSDDYFSFSIEFICVVYIRACFLWCVWICLPVFYFKLFVDGYISFITFLKIPTSHRIVLFEC